MRLRVKLACQVMKCHVFGYERQQRVDSLQGMLLEDEDDDRRDFVSLFQASMESEQERQRP